MEHPQPRFEMQIRGDEGDKPTWATLRPLPDATFKTENAFRTAVAELIRNHFSPVSTHVVSNAHSLADAKTTFVSKAAKMGIDVVWHI